MTQDWIIFHRDSDGNGTSTDETPRGFIQFHPGLTCTPPTLTKVPKGLDKVTKQIISEECRINNTAKLQDLLLLKDRVFCSRLERFYWDTDSRVESHRGTEETIHADIFKNLISSQNNKSPSTRIEYDYAIRSFCSCCS